MENKNHPKKHTLFPCKNFFSPSTFFYIKVSIRFGYLLFVPISCLHQRIFHLVIRLYPNRRIRYHLKRHHILSVSRTNNWFLCTLHQHNSGTVLRRSFTLENGNKLAFTTSSRHLLNLSLKVMHCTSVANTHMLTHTEKKKKKKTEFVMNVDGFAK